MADHFTSEKVMPEAPPLATLDLGEFATFTNRVVGIILTQVDASISDPVQRKAFKDIVKSRIWEDHHRMTIYAQNKVEGKLQSYPFPINPSDTTPEL